MSPKKTFHSHMSDVAKDFITVMSETKSVIERCPTQHLPGGNTSFHKWPVPEIAYPQVATIKHDDVHRLFPSEAEAVSLDS